MLDVYAATVCSGLDSSRGSKRPLKVYKSDVPEENLTFGLFLRSWKVEESKDRNPSFHLLYQPPLLVIVETNAGSLKFGEDHEAFVCAPACTICGSIVTRHYAFSHYVLRVNRHLYTMVSEAPTRYRRF